MADSYWARYWRKQASRRRFLQAGGGAAVGAAGLALVGCGGDSDDGDDDDIIQLATPTPSGAATATPSDPFANAKPGGTYRVAATGDAPSLDPYGNLSFLTKGFAAYHYSRLYKYKTGPGIEPAEVRPEPDIAASAEASPDAMKWTVKLRPGVKFHNVAPVNGRAVTTEDVKFSWSRLTAETTQNRSQVAFVDNLEFPDDSTIVFNLKTPNAAFLDVLADTNLLFIMPTESDGGFNPSQVAIGSGPWIFKSYEQSVKILRDKNPEWYMKGFPLFDHVETSIIPEYATRVAQFLAGNLDTVDPAGEDLITIKKQIPDAQLESRPGPTLSFMFFDHEADSPWRDPRVRQAFSMSLNRDDLTEVAYNVSKLEAAGLDIATPYHNIIPAGETRWWLDPTSSEMGEGAKYFKYDLTEARKLLEAAGFANGFDALYQYTNNRYGKAFNDVAELQIQYLQELGIKTTTEVQDYSSKYITQTFPGNFTGIAFGYQTPFPEAGSYLVRMFGDDPLNHGKVDDPTLKKLAYDQYAELDEERRKELFWEAQRYHATKMYYIPSQAGAGSTWEAHAPNLRNGVEHRVKGYGGGTETVVYRWKA